MRTLKMCKCDLKLNSKTWKNALSRQKEFQVLEVKNNIELVRKYFCYFEIIINTWDFNMTTFNMTDH